MSRRHPLFVLATLASALLLILAITVWRQYALDRAAQDLTLEVLESTLSTGTSQALVSNAHADLLAAMGPESLASYLASIPRVMGNLEALTSISGGAEVPWPLTGEQATAEYAVGLVFARSAATAQVALIRVEGLWQISHFVIDAPLLAN